MSEREKITSLTPEERVKELFGALHARAVGPGAARRVVADTIAAAERDAWNAVIEGAADSVRAQTSRRDSLADGATIEFCARAVLANKKPVPQ